MKKVKVLSLFSGIGAFEKALSNLGLPYELVGFSEIIPATIEAYCRIHGVSEQLNLGDVRNIQLEQLPEFDLLVAGFPCTDISHNGKQKGFQDKTTSSGLVHYAIETIRCKKPMYVVFENVKNLIGKNFKADFEAMLRDIEALGYSTAYRLINSCQFGVPQNRERVYMVFIRSDLDRTFSFELTEPQTKMTLDELLLADDEVDNLTSAVKTRIQEESVADFLIHQLPEPQSTPFMKIKCLNSKNKHGKQPSQQYRVYSRYGLMTTLSAQLNGRYNVVSSKGHLRKITPREAYLLQGFSEEDVQKVAHLSANILYEQAGNSISVPVLEAIFKNLFQLND